MFSYIGWFIELSVLLWAILWSYEFHPYRLWKAWCGGFFGNLGNPVDLGFGINPDLYVYE